MKTLYAATGVLATALGLGGCLGPDLGFVGGGGEGGSAATTTSLASTSSGETTVGTGGEGGSGPATTTSGPGGGGGGVGGAECEIPPDCPVPGDFCLDRTCEGGICGTTPLPDGLEVPAGELGDCKRFECQAGSTVEVDDDGDVPDDFNDCTIDACEAGTPSNEPAPADTSCGVGGDLFCDGAGTCIGCSDPGQCAGTDDDCKTRTCEGGACGVDFELPGTPATPDPGNCAEEVCDGAGNVSGEIDDFDLPVDGNECTEDRCDGGVASNPDLETGIPCGTGASCTEPPAVAKGQDVCNGFGSCTAQPEVPCDAPGPCFVPICNGDACDVDFALIDTPCDLAGTLDGFCDSAGACVECNDDTQCTGTETCDLANTCAPTEKIVFVTANAVLPSFGGTAGGDTICQAAASGAGLPGTFRAWLSDSSSTPGATFVQSAVPYRMVDGTLVANDWNDLVDGDLTGAISLAENGASIVSAEVWTGTTAGGDATASNCSDWTTTSATGTVGLTSSLVTWSVIYDQFCDRDNVRLYCFEQ